MLSPRILAALIPTSLMLAAPTAAHAERVVTQDAAADVESIRSDAEEDIFVPAPEHTTADIITTVVSHGANRVRVQVRYRDLADAIPQEVRIRVRTPSRRFDLQKSFGHPDGSTQFTQGQRGDVVRCRGMRSLVDRAMDQVTVSVPTACVGRPDWIQVGVLSITAALDVETEADDYVLYFDDAHRSGGFEDRDARLGPQVLAD